jgi:alpha-D-xyloside xylohydrolase
MAESLRGGLSLGLSGFGFWSHDIGGFEGLPPEDLFHRWLAFGLLSSHSRLHGSSSYRVPWAYGETAVEVARKFTLLKLALMPYLYAQAVETTRTGVPLMRAALLEYPEDLTCQTLDRQYFLGSQLLVAPVFRADGQVDVYLPEGRWTHLLSGEILVGPGWRRETHGPMSLPLYVKPNSVLAMAPGVTKPDSDWSSSLELHVFALDEGQSSVCELVEYHGRPLGAVKVTRNFSQYTVVSPTAVLPFTLVIGGKTYRIDKREQTV